MATAYTGLDVTETYLDVASATSSPSKDVEVNWDTTTVSRKDLYLALEQIKMKVASEDFVMAPS